MIVEDSRSADLDWPTGKSNNLLAEIYLSTILMCLLGQTLLHL